MRPNPIQHGFVTSCRLAAFLGRQEHAPGLIAAAWEGRRAIGCVAGLLLLAALGAAAPAEEAPAVAVTVSRVGPDVPACPGEAVPLRLALVNRTGRPVMLPDWELFAEMIDVAVRIADFPGAGGEAAPDRPASLWEGRPFQKRDFRALAPGETIIDRAATPVLPGKMRVTVTLSNPLDTYRSLTDGKTLRIENGWKGLAQAALTVDVTAAESPAMKVRYADYRERLADPLVPAEQKGRLLDAVAREGHYLAARFLRQAAANLRPGPMRDAAIDGLLRLAKAGPGYEHIPCLLQALGDPNVAQPQREQLLAWAAESLIRKGRLSVADQADYTWPDALQRTAREAIESATKDRNPYFAARAREALKQVARAIAPPP